MESMNREKLASETIRIIENKYKNQLPKYDLNTVLRYLTNIRFDVNISYGLSGDEDPEVTMAYDYKANKMVNLLMEYKPAIYNTMVEDLYNSLYIVFGLNQSKSRRRQ